MLESLRRCRRAQWCAFLIFLTGQTARAGLAPPTTPENCSAQAWDAAREADERARSFGPEGANSAASAFAEAAEQYARQAACLVDVPEKRAARIDAVELRMKMAVEAFRLDASRGDLLREARDSGQAIIAELERMYGESAAAKSEHAQVAEQIAVVDGLLPPSVAKSADTRRSSAVQDGQSAAKPRVPRGLVVGLAVSASVAAVCTPFVVWKAVESFYDHRDYGENSDQYKESRGHAIASSVAYGAALVPTIVLAVYVARARKAKTGVVARRGLGGYVLPARGGVAVGVNWRF